MAALPYEPARLIGPLGAHDTPLFCSGQENEGAGITPAPQHGQAIRSLSEGLDGHKDDACKPKRAEQDNDSPMTRREMVQHGALLGREDKCVRYPQAAPYWFEGRMNFRLGFLIEPYWARTFPTT